MEYLLLIYADESKEVQCEDPSEDSSFASILAEYQQFTKTVTDDGVMLGANPLEPVSTATTVRVRDGKTETTDGPFAETKEQLAGYYLLDCENLDEAIAYASKIPGARWGSIEVRPIRKFNEA